VVAEGVEDFGQLLHLQEENCDLAQGYLLGRPLPATEAGALNDAANAEIRSGNEAVVVRLALFANQPLIGFLGIPTGEFLLIRIPHERLVHADGNHAKMSHADGTMADFHIADGGFAAAHGLEKIPHMVAALVEFDGAFGQRFLE
jgi:hypothetical protein